jgi:uncharacterized DUF497 family protein
MARFEWDPAKAKRNLAKHGVSFEQASRVFDDPFALMLQDRVEQGEERWQAIGRAGTYLVIVVAHTVRRSAGDDIIRIISARRALRQERQRYEDQTD